MKATEVRGLSIQELNAKLGELKRDLFYLRMQHATNQLDNPIKIKEVKRNIARVQTIMREKQLEGKEVS
ncbi:MAG: 50S ribosomal protein L29 [Clostridiales bacterium]|jgi:large subunit ribosomal protein L29|nr:50S ribosomal protein L29 [Clostridiales bacterium]